MIAPCPDPFVYAPEDRRRICEHFERLGKAHAFEIAMKVLERSASEYLFLDAWDKALPDRATLEDLNQENLEIVRRAQAIMIRQCGPLPSIQSRTLPKTILDDEETDAAITSEISAITAKFGRDEISGVQLLFEMGVRALDLLIVSYSLGSPEARLLKNGRKKRRRRIFIEDVARLWAGLNGKDLSRCTISAVDGSLMLDFIKACLDPLTPLTGEVAGNETIKKIVSDIKREPQQVAELAD